MEPLVIASNRRGDRRRGDGLYLEHEQQTGSGGVPAQSQFGPAVDGGPTPTTTVPLTSGSWVTDCIPGGNESGIETLTFTASTMTLASVVYSDVACTNLSTTVTTVSGYVLGAASTAVPAANNLDVTPQKATLAIHDPATITTANTGTLYGYNNWVADQARDITLLTPAGGAQPLAKPFYTIIENDGDKLYMGSKKAATDDNTTVAGRDTQLNAVLTYFHQQ